MLAGCPKPVKPAPTSAGPLLERLDAHAKNVESVRADVKISMELGEDIELTTGQSKGKFNGVLTAASEARMRMEVFSPLGPVMYIMALSGRIVTALVPFSGEYARADVTDPGIAGPLAVLPVSLEELPELARGVIPLRSGQRKEIEDEAGRGMLVIQDSEGAEMQRVVFDPEGGWPIEARYAGSGEETDAVVIQFQQYQSVDEIALPTLIQVNAGSRGTASMTLKNIELNPELPEDLFEIPPPPGHTPTPN